MLPRRSSKLEDKSSFMGNSGTDCKQSNSCSSTLQSLKIDDKNRVGMDLKERIKEKLKPRRSIPEPTPVQTNPLFQQLYGKPITPVPSRQRRGSFLYKQDSSTLVGDVISQKLPSSRNVSLSATDDLIVTPFAQILAKLRCIVGVKNTYLRYSF